MIYDVEYLCDVFIYMYSFRRLNDLFPFIRMKESGLIFFIAYITSFLFLGLFHYFN